MVHMHIHIHIYILELDFQQYNSAVVARDLPACWSKCWDSGVSVPIQKGHGVRLWVLFPGRLSYKNKYYYFRSLNKLSGNFSNISASPIVLKNKIPKISKTHKRRQNPALK